MRHRRLSAIYVALLAVGCLAASGFATAQAAPGSPVAPNAAGAVRAADQGGDPDDGGGEEGEDDPLEVADQAAQYAAERSAPAASVSAAALLAARRQAAGLPVSSARLHEITDQPLDAEPDGYTDPVESNDGAGFRHVSGRATAVAVDGRTYYAGTADGGVWRSTDAGAHWTSIWDDQPTLSIGALLVVGHTLWVGTGEANTSSDSYEGTGVYRSTDGGAHFTRVGGSSMIDRQTFRLRDDGVGHVYAATSQGLYRHADSSTSGTWQLLLKPDPNPDDSPYRTSFITDVVIRPGTGGRTVLAALGWRGGTDYNGFYLSNAGGARGTFTKITPTGDIDAGDIGRTTLAYAADGSRLYAIVQSPEALNGGEDSNLQGVFASTSGDPAGPYTLIADSAKLDDSGSALRDLDGYHVGIQSWYNQALAVDPADPQHVYVSLEEVFETRNGGRSFTTASPYWNYGLACDENCPATTHPDQHASAITADGRIVIANDGGFYSRPMSVVGRGHWTDLNDTLRTLQYYDAAAGRSGQGLGYWGGLQDNGTSALLSGFRVNKEPAGGDGGYVLVDPDDATRAVGEYTNLTMYSTVDGGYTFRSISPVCGNYTNQRLCDPTARFTAPFQADVTNPNHWVALGSKVWDSTRGFNTVCERNHCTWTPVHDFGLDAAGGHNQGSALAVNGATTYAAWVDSSGNPSPAFRSGIDTNYGGTWHRLALTGLPNRFISGLTVDPADPAHVYAIYNGYSRRWIPGGGTGVVFESTDGGASWRNITGDLPDAPGDGLALVGGKLVLGTDIGLFVADANAPTRWSRVAGLPNVVVDNVRPVPGSSSEVVVATHGRGIWQVRV